MTETVAKIAEGSPIVLSAASPSYFHLPAEPRNAVTGRSVTLEEHLDAGGSPPAWAARCGVRGSVWLFRSKTFTRRTTCPNCVKAAARPDAELAPAAPIGDHCFFCFDQGGDDDGSSRCPACGKVTEAA